MYRYIAVVVALALCAQAQTDPRPACKVCEEVVGLAAKDRTFAEFEHDGRRVCEGLHEAERIECKRIMDNARKVWDYIHVEHHTPVEACTKVHACVEGTTTAAPPAQPAQFFPGECTICEEVIKVVEGAVTSDTTEGELEHLLDEACSKIPFVGSACKSLVNKEVPVLLKDLVNKLPPNECCRDIHACSEKQTEEIVHKVQFFPGECTICEDVIGVVEGLVTSDTTEGELEHLLDEACSKIPFVGNECKSLVNKEVPVLLKDLVNKLPPNECCRDIHACSNDKTKKFPQFSLGCTICEDAIKYIEEELAKGSTEAEIEKVIEDKVCSLVGPLQNFCDSLINEYVPKLINELNNDVPPEKACSAVRLC